MEDVTTGSSERVVPPLPAATTPRTLQQKFQYARQLESEIQRITQDWRNALGADVTNSLIFKHFKDRVHQIHGEQFELSYFIGKLQTNKGITSYISHIFRHITRLSTVVETEGVEHVSVEDQEVTQTIDRLANNFKNTISPENVLNILTFLLGNDCYVQILEVVAAEVSQIEPSLRNTVQTANPAPIPASPAFSLQDLDIQNDTDREENWERIDDEGGYGSADLTGTFTNTLVSHEESGDFDPSAIFRAQKYSELVKSTTQQIEGHEGDLSNEDFIQTLKILRMENTDRKKFSVREISEITRQVTALLERLHLDISHLSIRGVDRSDEAVQDNKQPFILVKVKTESEARAILEKAVYVIDSQRYIATPKSNRLVRFNIEFEAAAANLQVSTERIVEFLSGTVFSEFVARIVFIQSFNLTTKNSSRFVRRFYAILRPPLGQAPEPQDPDPLKEEHQLYFIPVKYIFNPLGVIHLTQCSAWECKRCHPHNKKYGHCSRTCPEITQTKGKGKGKGRGKGNFNSAYGASSPGSRGAGSARWEQNRARAEKRKSEPTSQSPAHKQLSGIERREEIATAAKRGGANISGRFL